MTRLELQPAPIDGPQALTLVAELQQFYFERYGGTDRTPFTGAEFAPPDGGFWLAVLTGQLIGCLGLRRHDPQTAELKRMYVRAAYRRQGLGKEMLAEAERRAVGLGYRRLILEAGNRQPEALAFYQARGYARIANYGYHLKSGDTRSFVKLLDSPPQPPSGPAEPG